MRDAQSDAENTYQILAIYSEAAATAIPVRECCGEDSVTENSNDYSERTDGSAAIPDRARVSGIQ